MTQTPIKQVDYDGLAHELFSLAQVYPNEGIEDAANRISMFLKESFHQPADAQGLVRELLPYDVEIGGVVFRKGVPLAALINAATRWKGAAERAFIQSTGRTAEELRAEFPKLPEEEQT